MHRFAFQHLFSTHKQCFSTQLTILTKQHSLLFCNSIIPYYVYFASFSRLHNERSECREFSILQLTRLWVFAHNHPHHLSFFAHYLMRSPIHVVAKLVLHCTRMMMSPLTIFLYSCMSCRCRGCWCVCFAATNFINSPPPPPPDDEGKRTRLVASLAR